MKLNIQELEDGLMKTTRFITILAGISLSVIAGSCAKEQNDEKESVKIRDMVFSAESELTRTSLSGTSVLWSDNDEISVFSGLANQRFVISQMGNGNASASFSGSAVSASTYYALYPYDENATNSNGVITTTLPATQTFTSGSFSNGANLTVASTAGNSLMMKNVGAYVSFVVNQDGVTSVTLSADTFLAGKIEIDATGSNPTATVVDGYGSKSITLSGSFVAGNKYYFVVLPGTHTNLKMTMNIGGNDLVFANGAPVTLNRKDNVAFGTIAAKLASPSNVTFNQATYASNRKKTLLNNISWDPVPNATGYVVTAGGNDLTVDGTSAMLGTLEGDMTVTVKAVNDTYPDLFLDSDVASLDINARYYGAGVAAYPWRIYDATDWEEFADEVSGYSYSGKYVTVMADIDFNNAAVTSAGTNSSHCFGGTFDGGNHTFSNLQLGSSDATSAGLFRFLAGTVKNLVVDGATVTELTGQSAVTRGAVISGGTTTGSIESVTVRNSSITCGKYGAIIVCDLSGNESVIKDCTVDNCSISADGECSGLIVASAGSTCKIISCQARNCTVSGFRYVGGIAGDMSGAGAYVVNCISRGNDITATAAALGALVGRVNAAVHIVNNLSASNKVRNTTNTTEAYMSLLLGREAATAGKVQNNVVSSGEIYHACTSKPRIGFFVGTKGSGAWSINYYNLGLVTTANKGSGGNMGPIGNTSFAGATTGGSTSVGDDGTVVLSDLVSTLNGNITSRSYANDFPEIQSWITGSDGWPTFDFE